MPTLQKSDAPKQASLAQIAELTRRRGVRQFVKFSIVGASSTVITFIVLNLALHILHGHRFISAGIAFVMSVGNGYIWNKRWTFREALEKAAHTQFTQFVLVNIVGLILTEIIMRLVANPMDHQLAHRWPMMAAGKIYKLSSNIGQLVAIPIVVFWNFFANRHWTFKH